MKTEFIPSEAPYCLHDMHITDIEIDEDKITLRFQYGFVKTSSPAAQVDGYIEIPKVDFDFSYVYLLEYTDVLCGNAGHFKGEKYFLKDFLDKKWDYISFDVIDETFGFNKTKLEGYFNQKGKCYECMIEIYHFGKITYHTDE